MTLVENNITVEDAISIAQSSTLETIPLTIVVSTVSTVDNDLTTAQRTTQSASTTDDSTTRLASSIGTHSPYDGNVPFPSLV